MIDLYYWPTPNGHKITMFLEETGLAYKIHPINIGTGDQFAGLSGVLAEQPHARDYRSGASRRRRAREDFRSARS